MKYEIRVRNYERIDEVIGIKPDIIGVGDEGCFYKLPSPEKTLEIKKKLESVGIKFRLITPKIFQKHYENAIHIIKELSKAGNNYFLTINDLGLLHICHEQGILPESITLGRGMTRSFIECPWYENFLRDEDEELQRTIVQNYMAHKVKIDFFSQYGVNAIEANMVSEQEDAYKNIIDNGWKIYVHYGYMTVSVSRICQTAKYHKMNPPDCLEKCKEGLTLQMSQIHTKRTDFEISEDAKKRVPEFILKGNILYRENPQELAEFNVDCVDTLILSDIQYPTAGELSKAYEIIQGVLNNEKAEIKSSN
jgi:hypothetical protein